MPVSAESTGVPQLRIVLPPQPNSSGAIRVVTSALIRRLLDAQTEGRLRSRGRGLPPVLAV